MMQSTGWELNYKGRLYSRKFHCVQEHFYVYSLLITLTEDQKARVCLKSVFLLQ